MAYKQMSFDERIKENIKDYDFGALFKTEVVASYIRSLSELLKIDILLTDASGKTISAYGNWDGTALDGSNISKRKIKVKDRTVAYLYASEDNELLDQTANMMCFLGRQSYLYTESSIYINELEQELETANIRRTRLEKHDPLTGVLNTLYFNKRMVIIDRSEVAPVAIIEANINDWKYANDHFGDEGSDRLIKIIADILKAESKPEYIIGRIDGDVFVIVIPMPEDGEAEEYVSRIQSACNNYDDSVLSPSIACGIVYKENVEETISDKISDAEYLMFENKFDIKNSKEYQKRLHRGE